MPNNKWHSKGAERKMVRAARKMGGKLSEGLSRLTSYRPSGKDQFKAAGESLSKTGKRAKKSGFKFGG
jgi:hypothetical protein